MSATLDELEDFQRFAKQQVQSGADGSLAELFDRWSLEHPSAEEQADVHDAIRQGLADIEAGRSRPASVVMQELRAKYGLPRE
jgi:hypothetical protein